MSIVKNALWAEDQREFVESLRPLVSALADELVCVEDGAAALALLRERPFELVLLDLQMPPGAWGGLDLLRAIDVRQFCGPVVVLSGAGTLSESIEAMRLGASQYIEKERAQAELVGLVRKAVDDHREKRGLDDYACMRKVEVGLKQLILGMLTTISQNSREAMFRSVVPRAIALKTYERWLDGDTGTQEDYFDVLDYATIIQKYWGKAHTLKALERVLSPRKSDDRVAWIQDFNEARKVIAHASRGEASAEDKVALRRALDVVLAWEKACVERQVE